MSELITASLGLHGGYIVAAYGAAAVSFIALLAWIMMDGRRQQRRIAELEAQSRALNPSDAP